MTSTEDPSSFQHGFAQVNGAKIHYVEEGSGNAAIVLLHGYPDLWYGWRKQIRFLAARGYRVIVPDMRGIGESEAPQASPTDMSVYSWKTRATDVAELMTHLGVDKAVIVGHDWGSHMASRFVLHFPKRVKALVLVSVPFQPPTDSLVTVEMIAKVIPHFQYQVMYARDPNIQKKLESNTEKFIIGIFRTREDDLNLDGEHDYKKSNLLTEQETKYYTSQYQKSGFGGALACYKLKEISFEEERDLPRTIDDIPVLMITTGRDKALPPIMSRQMPRDCKHLTMKHIEEASHWVMVEQTEEFNKILADFLDQYESIANSK